VERHASDEQAAARERSPYATRFSQGAILVPRFMFIVEPSLDAPLGAGAGRRRIRSKRTSNEKSPWKSQPSLSGSVERQFIRPTLVGDSVLPFRLRPPQEGVIPWDGTDLVRTTGERLDLYPGLAQWWREASALWDRNKSSGSSLSLLEQIDYRHKLRDQLPGSPIRVVYSKSGMYLAAAIVEDETAVIDHKLYWAAAGDRDEALFLVSVLNSTTLLKLIQPLQARGEHNPRDFDKYVWQSPIPLYDGADELHKRIVRLGERAEAIASGVELPAQAFQALRRRIRNALEGAGLTEEWEETIVELFEQS
jgi:hypothetical protein